MDPQTGTILSTLLKKRLKTLGYPSLRKFHADRPGLGLSYEVLRQVVYGSHIPRPETLFRILGSMQFSSSQVRKICGMHYGDYLPISPCPGRSLPSPAQGGAGSPESPADPGAPYPAERPGRKTNRPPRRWRNRERSSPASAPPFSESRFPATRISGRWSKRWRESRSRRSAGAPVARRSSLYCSPGNPKRSTSSSSGRTGSSPYLSRGENLTFDFVDGIDYRDRFRGALLGSAVGEALGTITQGLTPRDVRSCSGSSTACRSSPPPGGPRRRKTLSSWRSPGPSCRTESSTRRRRPTRSPARAVGTILRASRGSHATSSSAGYPGTRQEKTPRKACPPSLYSPLHSCVPGTSEGLNWKRESSSP